MTPLVAGRTLCRGCWNLIGGAESGALHLAVADLQVEVLGPVGGGDFATEGHALSFRPDDE